MFEEFFAHCKPTDEVKPSKKRVNKNIAAVRSLIETEGISMTETKRKIRIKPLIIAAAAVVASMATLFTVNASTGGELVRFFIGGKEIEGGYQDYIDDDGYRHMAFDAIVPVEALNYAVIFDSDVADFEEAVRVVTDESDPELFENLRQYSAAQDEIIREREALMEAGVDKAELPELPSPTEFGIVFKDSELCYWNFYEVLEDGNTHGYGGCIAGSFMETGAAEDHRRGTKASEHQNYDSDTKRFHLELYYYVG
ncbi:MAG: hypothetical protein K2J77_09800, partial [Oscillospiraceae bacterium]|nr:hypothetical protein [Oscillospiraceae bacterium]